jgi:hypothetical protein
MPPSPPIQCCVDDWKEKIQHAFSNIDHGGRGPGRSTYFKMAKNVKSLIIFAPDCREPCILNCTFALIQEYLRVNHASPQLITPAYPVLRFGASQSHP